MQSIAYHDRRLWQGLLLSQLTIFALLFPTTLATSCLVCASCHHAGVTDDTLIHGLSVHAAWQ